MLYEASTYKDIDDFNQDAADRYQNIRAGQPFAEARRFWKVLHLNVGHKGVVLVLWCREDADTVAG